MAARNVLETIEVSHYANYVVALAEREAQQRGQRDPRERTDLYLPGFAQRLHLAHVHLKTARTRLAIETFSRRYGRPSRTRGSKQNGAATMAACAQPRSAWPAFRGYTIGR